MEREAGSKKSCPLNCRRGTADNGEQSPESWRRDGTEREMRFWQDDDHARSELLKIIVGNWLEEGGGGGVEAQKKISKTTKSVSKNETDEDRRAKNHNNF